MNNLNRSYKGTGFSSSVSSFLRGVNLNYTQCSDAELLAALTGGDRHAFTAIYHRHWPVLYRTAFRRLKDVQKSEDIVQDIFVRLWSRRLEARIGNLKHYLLRAVRYGVLNYVARDQAPGDFYEPFEDVLISSFTADAPLLEKELRLAAELFLKMLPERKREICRLRFTENLSTQEIADRLSISRKTVQNHLGSAMNELRLRLTTCLFLLCLLRAADIL